MRILGIDYGEKRIGLALSDEMEMTARGLSVIERRSKKADLEAIAAAKGLDPVRWAIRGGEDYALLGACAPGQWETLAAGLPQARAIGRVVPTPGLFLGGERLDLAGFDHFAPHD